MEPRETGQQQSDLQALLTDLRSDHHDSTSVSSAMQAIHLATNMDDILTIIDVIEHRFPRDHPTTASCLGAAKVKHNSFSVINMLPAEVLVEIIRSAASDRRMAWRGGPLTDPGLLTNLCRLSLVCRHWKDLIDASGDLWVFLTADTRSLRPLEMAMAKSRNVPVVIALGTKQMDRKDFVAKVSSLIPSCRVLSLMSQGMWHWDDDEIYHLIRAPSPILEELHLDGPGQGFRWSWENNNPQSQQSSKRQKTEIWAIENSSETLKVLRLRNLDWCWDHFTLSNLRYLQVCSVKISASELIGCLSGTPRLRSLHVERLTELEDWTRTTPVLQSEVLLPSLRRVHMEDVSPAFAHDILSNTAPSSLKHLVLSTTGFAKPVPFTETSSYHHLLRSLVAAEATKFTTICVGPQDLYFVIDHKDGENKFYIHGSDLSTPTQRSDFVQWLSSLWAPLDPKSPLKIHLGIWGIIIRGQFVRLHAELVSTLFTLDNVTELFIASEVGDVPLLYGLLSRPLRLASGKWSWGFPKLEVLIVEGQSRFEEQLVQMLQARYDAIAQEHSGGLQNSGESMATAISPSKLKTLQVIRGSFTQEFWRQVQDIRLKQIVGDEHFIAEFDERRRY